MSTKMAARSSVCLLLLCGPPSCGKTLLVNHLTTSGKLDKYNLISLSCDKYYPPHPSCPLQDTGIPFSLRAERRKLNLCIYKFLSINGFITEYLDHEKQAVLSKGEFQEFLDVLSFGPLLEVSRDGRIRMELDFITFVIDDNMIYNSIRHEYYQMARDGMLGLGILYITCDVKEAIERNIKRGCPIPEVTLIKVHHDAEQPDMVTGSLWEKNCCILKNSNISEEVFLEKGLTSVMALLDYAGSNPWQPLSTGDSEAKDASRAANKESLVHQADVLLRKSVSEYVKKNTGVADKKAMAETANKARKLILDQIRNGELVWQGNIADENFAHFIHKQFTKLNE